MALKASKWINLFETFIKDIRISSKEVVSADGRGSKLDLWDSQKRFMNEVGAGLDDGIHKFNCLKSRQLGITTISIALVDVFWPAMHPGIIGCLVTDDEKKREANRSLIVKYVESFPEGYFGDEFRIVKNNRTVLEFSNGARLDLLVAGTKKKSIGWAEGVGYAFAHLTEASNYGDVEGLKSLEEGFAQQNPHRLFVYESTAKGYNHWHERYAAGKRNHLTERSFFIGWWASASNMVARSDPLFSVYGNLPPVQEEKELIAEVARLYGHKITAEQLAWFRFKEQDAGAERDLLDQNQPWTEQQSFVQTGYSFFQTRQISKDIQKIKEAGVVYKAYEYDVGSDFYHFSMRELKPDVDSPDQIELKVWEEPKENGKYVIGYDGAYGRNDHKDATCLSADTEILTKQGWKKYQDIQIDDEAVCFDLNCDQYYYDRISKVVVKHHTGDMIQITSKGLDSLVTPDHRVISRNYRVLRNGKKQSWRAYLAQEIADAGRSVREIPVGGSPIGKGVKDLSLEMCRALGWILTDGHISISKYRGGERQKGRKLRAIREAIVLVQATTTVKAGVNVSEEMRRVMRQLSPACVIDVKEPRQAKHAPRVVIRVGVQEAEAYMAWLGRDYNRIPRRILEDGSAEQLEAFMQGILEGDGGWRKSNNTWATVHPGHDAELADDIQELALKLGYSPTIVKRDCGTKGWQWVIQLSVRDTHTFEAPNAKTQHYSGDVWCVTVPTGAFVARRNGTAFVTGNCVEVYRCFADKIVQVAEYAANHHDPRHTAWILFHLCAAYRDCMVNVEVGGPSKLVMQEFDHLRQLLGSEMMAKQTAIKGWEDAAANARWYLYHRPDSTGAGYMYNFETNYRTKGPLMHGMRSAYLCDEIEVKSVKLLNEMSIVIYNDGEIAAPESRDPDKKDDRVFATAFATLAWTDWIRKSMIADGMTYARVMELESGEKSPVGRRMENIVYGFLKRREQEAEEEAERPHQSWLSDQGLE